MQPCITASALQNSDWKLSSHAARPRDWHLSAAQSHAASWNARHVAERAPWPEVDDEPDELESEQALVDAWTSVMHSATAASLATAFITPGYHACAPSGCRMADGRRSRVLPRAGPCEHAAMKQTLASCLSLLVGCSAAPPPSPAPVVAAPSATAAAPAGATLVAAPVAARPSAPTTGETCKLAWTNEPVWSATTPSVGPPTARLTIVWFFELDDPFSAHVAPRIAELRDELGPENVRIVWRHHPLPFHKTARRAGKAAQHVFETRGGEPFWRFVRDALAARPPHTDARLFELASREGVTDRAAFDAALDDPRLDAELDDGAALARALGMLGVPAFLLNGEVVNGAQPLETFREAARRATARTQQSGRDACAATQLALPERPSEPAPSTAPAPVAEPVDFVAIPVGASPSRGPADAPVTIVAFGGYQDPFSRRATGTIHALLDQHKADVRYVWKDHPLPFHKHAITAATLVRRAHARGGASAFFRVHDELMAATTVDDASLAAFAARHGLGAPSPTKTPAIEADLALGEAAGVRGTPTFFVNGRRLVGARPEADFEQVIGEELAKAKGLLARGTPRAGIYDAALRANGARPPATKQPTP